MRLWFTFTWPKHFDQFNMELTGVPHYLMSNLAETWMKYILRRNSICFYTTKIVRSWFPAFSWPCLADDIIRVFLQWIQSNFNATRWSLSVNDPSRRSGFHLRSAVKLREKWFTSNIILPHGWLGLWRSCRCRWPSVGRMILSDFGPVFLLYAWKEG